MDNLKKNIESFLQDANLSLTWEEILSVVDGVNASSLALDDKSWLNMLSIEKTPPLELNLLNFRRSRIIEIEKSADFENSKTKLDNLRTILLEMNVNGLILPRADEHQGEYLPSSSERLSWITGFDGSAGFVVVLEDSAAVFTDGRYTLQILQQVDQNYFDIEHITENPPIKWLEKRISKGDRIGFDPWLHSADALRQFESSIESKGGKLVALDANPIDQIWKDRPSAPLSPIVPHHLSYSGKPSAEKRKVVCEVLRQNREGAVILTSPESIAWLLNIRGADVSRTPLPLSFAILNENEHVSLFTDIRKVTNLVTTHLGNEVSIFPFNDIGQQIDSLVNRDIKIRIDPKSNPAWFERYIDTNKGIVSYGEDPVLALKAIKNSIELAGTRNAHIRDGVAFARFLHWFEENASLGQLDEIGVANQLKSYREEDPLYKDQSFDAISGSGPNGAIVHYRVSPATNRILRKGDLYLIDSGAQYLDGTTDITRTLAIGDPGDEARDRFTRVLKGHIGLATQKFPKGTTGSQIDVLARAPLWSIGVDFDHGTGHGVGSYLGVHEGPQRISKTPSSVALQPGMIISNEPGYYKKSSYGIRLENLVVVQAVNLESADREMLGFETITFAPFDNTMIDASLLTHLEIEWINSYHASVRQTLGPLLPPEVASWLEKATMKIQ